MAVTFDTLKAARRLQDEAGFDEKQAAVLVSTFAEGVTENLATKTELSTEATAIRADLKDAEARLVGQITAIRADMGEREQRIYVRVGAMIASAAVFLTAVISIATAILLANL